MHNAVLNDSFSRVAQYFGTIAGVTLGVFLGAEQMFAYNCCRVYASTVFAVTFASLVASITIAEVIGDSTREIPVGNARASTIISAGCELQKAFAVGFVSGMTGSMALVWSYNAHNTSTTNITAGVVAGFSTCVATIAIAKVAQRAIVSSIDKYIVNADTTINTTKEVSPLLSNTVQADSKSKPVVQLNTQQ